MIPLIRADHYSAEIVLGSYRIKVPGTVGKKENKILAHRVRNRLFNESLAKVWLRESKDGRTIFHGALRALTENKK